MQHLVYLHGFLSSPQSEKAQRTFKYAKQYFPALNVYMPELSGNIHKTQKQIASLVATLPMAQTCFIGSSMGGFLSTYLLEKYALDSGAKAVLINPAVEPYTLLNDFKGRHINPYTQEVFYIQSEHIQTLKQMATPKLMHKSQYKVLLQTGDETLDYRLAVAKYGEQNCIIEQGGDHGFQGYEARLPSIFSFLFTG